MYCEGEAGQFLHLQLYIKSIVIGNTVNLQYDWPHNEEEKIRANQKLCIVILQIQIWETMILTWIHIVTEISAKFFSLRINERSKTMEMKLIKWPKK